MSGTDPIETYIGELKRTLHAGLARRRRILSEVRAHLRDAAQAEQERDDCDWHTASKRAVARFGSSSQTAAAFRGVGRTRRRVPRGALVPWLAGAALASVGSATVWATQGPSNAHPAPIVHVVVHRHHPDHHR